MLLTSEGQAYALLFSNIVALPFAFSTCNETFLLTIQWIYLISLTLSLTSWLLTFWPQWPQFFERMMLWPVLAAAAALVAAFGVIGAPETRSNERCPEDRCPHRLLLLPHLPHLPHLFHLPSVLPNALPNAHPEVRAS